LKRAFIGLEVIERIIERHSVLREPLIGLDDAHI
jgi:hypothetical protein